MADLVVNLKVNDDGTAQLRKFTDETKKTETSAKTASSTVDTFASSLGNLKSVIIGGLGFAALTSQVQSFISTAGQFEQYAVSLKVLTGSAQNAGKALEWVKDFTAKTPYTLNETMDAFIRLKAYGIDATSGSLKTLGDTAAAMGKPLMSAVEAMADALTGENERLKEFGIRASKSGDMVAYSWRDSSGKAKEAIIKNNSEIIQSTLEAIFNEKYAGMMDEQSKTWVGMVSNLEDTWTSFKDQIARDSGAFETAKETIASMTQALQGQNETVNKYLPIIETLAITYGILKTASVAAAVSEVALEAIRKKSIVTSTVYDAGLMRNVTTQTTLTVAQTAGAFASSALSTAMKAIPFVAVVAGVAGLVAWFIDAKNKSDDLRDSINSTRDSLSKLTAQELSSKRENLSLSLQEVSLERRTKQQQYGARSGWSQAEKSEIDALLIEEKRLRTASKNIAEAQTNIRNDIKKTSAEINKPAPTTSGGSGLTKEEQKALDKAKKEAEKAAKELADTEQKMLDERMNDGIKRFEEEQRVQLGYLESYADIEAKQALEQFEIEKGYLEAYADLEAKAAIEEYDRQVKFWDDLFSNINKSMESQFFDAMTGRFQSFGSWLKDFWKSITSSLASGLSKTLADYMMGGLKGGIQNSFASFGGLSGALGSIATPSYLAGATTDSAGFTTTVGGTVMDAAGQITKQGSDIASIVSNASTLKDLAMGGLYAPSAYMGQLAGTAYGAGFTGTGSFLGGVSNAFAGGSASGLNGAAFAGNVLGAGAMGGLGGYALGSLGDSLFGVQTKAADYGAIGGATGAVIGSVVPVVGTLVGGIIGSALGSVIGGAFGSTKFEGFRATEATGSADNIQQWYKKESWFSSSSKYKSLTEAQKNQINGIFETYDYLLGQLGGVGEIIIGAGKYKSSTFFSAIDKSFIRAFIDNPALTDTFYTAWTAYAKKIGKGVQETFATLVSDYVDYTRTFQTWSLESSGNSLESMRLQAEWAQKDLDAIQSLYGTSGVTADNYLDMYQKAIKESFTPETITQWQTLGDALMKATDANEKYKESLASSTSLIPNDMMLSRTGALTEALSISQMVDNQSTQTQQTATMVAQLYEVVKVLKQQLTIAQFGSTSGVPA